MELEEIDIRAGTNVLDWTIHILTALPITVTALPAVLNALHATVTALSAALTT